MARFIGLSMLSVKPGQDDHFSMQADILDLARWKRSTKGKEPKNDDRPRFFLRGNMQILLAVVFLFFLRCKIIMHSNRAYLVCLLVQESGEITGTFLAFDNSEIT
jgi:hypothetical protein